MVYPKHIDKQTVDGKHKGLAPVSRARRVSSSVSVYFLQHDFNRPSVM